MAFINTSRKVGVSIGGRNYSDNLISGTISDDSALNTSIIKASGTIVLGGTHGDNHVDLFGNRFSVGDPVRVVCSVPGGGGLGATHPRGNLYVISSSADIQQQQTNVEVGCKLQLFSTYERVFSAEIFELFGLIQDQLKYFSIPDYSLSTLDAILQTMGKAIFQCSGGGIQIIDVPVSSAGAGGGGFTSFDTETAIEMATFADASASDDPLSLAVTLSYEIPKDPKEDETEDPPEDDNPETEGDPDPDPDPDPNTPQDEVLSEISYTKTQKLKLKPLGECLKVYKGKKTIIDFDDAKALRSCGKYLNPKYIVTQEEIDQWLEGDACQEPLEADAFIKEEEEYSYAVEGSLEVEEEVYFSDFTESFSCTKYTGPGNQAEQEWTWESQSAWSYGRQIIDQWYDFARTEFENAASEANSWMEQANEYFALRDENNIYGLTETEVECLSLAELIKMRRDYFFYDCSGVNALLNADNLIEYCENIYKTVYTRLNSINGLRSLNNFNIKKTTFGAGGEVVKRVTTQISHRAESHLAKEYIDKFAKVFDEQEPDFFARVVDRTKELPTYGRYRFEPAFNDGNIRLLSEIDFPPVRKFVSGDQRSRTVNFQIDTKYELEPEDNGDLRGSGGLLVASSRTIETYKYRSQGSTPIIEEKSETIDYANKNNNSTQIKVSTDFSTAADAEALNSESAEAVGDDDDGVTPEEQDNPCEITTERREVIYRVSRSGNANSQGSELSPQFAAYEEQISLPAQLRPLVPQLLDLGQQYTTEDCNALRVEAITEAGERLVAYEQIITKYLTFEMYKRLGDNRGFRVTESMRPELYNYHPYMNVSLVSRVNGFSCSGMVGSANWAFDSSNALCSFDCFVFGYNSGVPFGDATTVSVQKPVTIPPGDYVVLTTDILEVTDSAYEITLQKIENPYYKYYLDDVELSEEPTVLVIDIVNGRLRLYNLTPDEEGSP